MAGGMQHDIVMVATVHGANQLVAASEASDFTALCTVLQGKYGHSIQQLYYVINPGQRSPLLNDSDFTNMITICRIIGLKVIQIGTNEALPQANMNPNNSAKRRITDFFTTSKHTGLSEGNSNTESNVDNAPRKRTHRVVGVPQSVIDTEQNDHSSTPPKTPANVQRHKPRTKSQKPNEFNNDRGSYELNTPLARGMAHNFDLSMFKSSHPEKSARMKHTEKMGRGDFFPGATTNFPMYDIAPEEEQIGLRSANWISYIEGPGQIFRGGVAEFRHKLVKYAAKVGFKFVYSRNDARYVKARCKMAETENCTWFVDAGNHPASDEVILKTCNLVHTCKLSMTRNDIKRLGCRILGNIITDAVRADPSKSPMIIKEEFQRFYGFKIPYEKVWRGVEIARANLFGSYDDSFDELRWYSQAIIRTNPGSLVFLETDPVENRFKRLFVSFHASREGFKRCRPILFVDGTFMKTRYKGTILSATAKDGNKGLFPLAIALVNAENNDNWSWFLTKLKDNIDHPQEVMYVSDRAGGLMHAFDAVYTKPLHFFCLFHLMKNLRAMYKGRKYSDIFKNTMCKYLSEMAYAPNVRYFEEAKRKFLSKGDSIAMAFLEELPCEKWAVAFAPEVHRYGELTSNAAESFNNWILPARGLPITFMVDCIRTQLMKWFSERRVAGSKWTGALTEEMEIKWNESKAIGDSWTIIPANTNGVFEVLSAKSCVVNISAKTCTCYQWQVRGFPCPHAIAVLKRANWDIREVIDSCFFSDTYQQIYAVDINPIADTEKHEFVDLNFTEKINPPIHRRVPGRPRKKRFRSTGEARGDKFICGRCGEYGYHYWTTCRDAL